MTERAGGQPAAETPVAGRRWADLAPRVVSGLVMIGLALGTAWAGGAVFAGFWLLAALAINWEWQRLLGEGATLRFIAGAAALAAAVPFASVGRFGVALPVLALGAVLAAVAAPGRRVVAAAGVLYAAAAVLPPVLLRNSALGLEAILWLFAVVWGTDIMAYFGGRLIGGPKLSPRWSPKKTWSGFLVGVTAGALAGLAVSPAGSSLPAVALLGVVAAVLAQAGDIAESSLKRRYGAKDSSHLIPGHGGVMDRLDGFVVAALFALCVGFARVGVDGAALGLFNWS